MARCRFAFLLLFVVTGVASAPRADDVDVAEEKLAKAREVHAGTISQVREAVAKQIETKVAAEEKRKNPDLKKIEALQSERENLGLGDFPKWVEARQRRQVADATKKLAESLTETKRSYTLAKDIDKAKAIDMEIQELLRPAAPKLTVNPFKKSTVWVGIRTDLDPRNPGLEVKYKLVITEQTGAQFRGQFSINDGRRDDYIITGLVNRNRVEFSEIGDSAYKMNITGKIDGENTLVYRFNGTRSDGSERYRRDEIRLLAR